MVPPVLFLVQARSCHTAVAANMDMISILKYATGWAVYVCTSFFVTLLVSVVAGLLVWVAYRTMGEGGIYACIVCVTKAFVRSLQIWQALGRDIFAWAREEPLETLATNKRHYFWSYWIGEERDGITVYDILLERAEAQGGDYAQAIYDSILMVACNNGRDEWALRFLDTASPHLHNSWRPLDNEADTAPRHLQCRVGINVNGGMFDFRPDPAMFPLTILCYVLSERPDRERGQALCKGFIRQAASVLPPTVIWARCERRGSIAGEFYDFYNVLEPYLALLHEMQAKFVLAPPAVQQEGEEPKEEERTQLAIFRENLFRESCFTCSWDAARDIIAQSDPGFATSRDENGLMPRDFVIAGIARRHNRLPNKEETDIINSLFDKAVKSAVW